MARKKYDLQKLFASCSLWILSSLLLVDLWARADIWICNQDWNSMLFLMDFSMEHGSVSVGSIDGNEHFPKQLRYRDILNLDPQFSSGTFLCSRMRNGCNRH